MINEEQMQEILSQYEKHGWNLRRVLLCDETRKNLADSLKELFGKAEIVESGIDAAWFSRPSKKEREAWEIRHLSENPLALIETFEKDETENFREETQKELETHLENLASRSKR